MSMKSSHASGAKLPPAAAPIEKAQMTTQEAAAFLNVSRRDRGGQAEVNAHRRIDFEDLCA